MLRMFLTGISAKKKQSHRKKVSDDLVSVIIPVYNQKPLKKLSTQFRHRFTLISRQSPLMTTAKTKPNRF